MTSDEKLARIREIVTWHRDASAGLGPDASQIVSEVLAVIDGAEDDAAPEPAVWMINGNPYHHATLATGEYVWCSCGRSQDHHDRVPRGYVPHGYPDGRR